jgi:hypothetical protein
MSKKIITIFSLVVLVLCCFSFGRFYGYQEIREYSAYRYTSSCLKAVFYNSLGILNKDIKFFCYDPSFFNIPKEGDWLRTQSNASSSLEVFDKKITFEGLELETDKTYPSLMDSSDPDLDTRYSYSIVNDFASSAQLLRVDEMYLDTDTNKYDTNESLFYYYDAKKIKYIRVFPISKQQNKLNDTSYSLHTEIISQNPLTIRLIYAVSDPIGDWTECSNKSCYAYWGDYYRWDNTGKKFILVNNQYLDFYLSLYKDYQTMSNSACPLGDKEEKKLPNLIDIYNVNSTDYCNKSSRKDLDNFFRNQQMVQSLIK